jgi:hypothetical protein
LIMTNVTDFCTLYHPLHSARPVSSADRPQWFGIGQECKANKQQMAKWEEGLANALQNPKFKTRPEPITATELVIGRICSGTSISLRFWIAEAKFAVVEAAGERKSSRLAAAAAAVGASAYSLLFPASLTHCLSEIESKALHESAASAPAKESPQSAPKKKKGKKGKGKGKGKKKKQADNEGR